MCFLVLTPMCVISQETGGNPIKQEQGHAHELKSAFSEVSFSLYTNDPRVLGRFRNETVRNEDKIVSIEYSIDYSTMTIKYVTTLGEDQILTILKDGAISILDEKVEQKNP